MEYGPTLDVAFGLALQGSVRDNVVTVVEKWENLDMLKKHLQVPHMALYRPKVQDFVVGTKLQVLAPVK